MSRYTYDEDYDSLLKSLDNATKDAVIDVKYLVLRYTACPDCVYDLGKQCRKSFSSSNSGIKLNGRCLNLDHIYLKWLSTGQERILIMECPHHYERHSNCYYMRGKATIYLGANIKENIHDYLNVVVDIDISDRTKIKLVTRTQ